jgi:proteasome lid subunit RPN8/RPN11
MKIAADLLDEIVAHALEDPKIECCGVVAVQPAGDGGEPAATRVYRAENIHASALKFEIDPHELLELYNACERDGGELGAIYHSHVRSAPYPSQTDIGFAASWPGVEWIIVGLAAGEQPLVKSYLIDGADVQEVSVGVTQPARSAPAGAGGARS